MKKLIYILILFFSSESFGQVTAIDLERQALSSGSTSITTDAVSIVSGDLLCVLVYGRVSSGTPAAPTFSGFNVTSWTQIETVTFEGSLRRITAFIGVANSTSSTTGTATWAVSHHQRYIQVIKIEGTVNTNNGLDAMVQYAANTGTSANPSISLASRANNSAAVATYITLQSSGTLTIDTDYVDINDPGDTRFGPTTSFGQPLAIMHLKQESGTDNTPSLTLSGSFEWAGLAIEFAGASRRIIQSN